MNARALVLLGAGLAAATAASGQSRRTVRPDSVTVVADSTFARSGVVRLLLGPTYRDLWATPIRVAVLDPDRFAGGLTPLQRGGGLQTVSLRLKGADGREYQFRLLQKQPEISEEANGLVAHWVLRDQMSANLPVAPLMLPPFHEAAGILHAPPLLRYMPDHPRLGEFREEFGNQVGTIEERPTDGFAGARDVQSTEDMLEALVERPWVRVDTRAFLTTRLVDLLVGDWDRHEDQYRWALMGKGDRARWVPIPRDRDQAFSRFDGALLGLVRAGAAGKLLVFDETYASPQAATFNGRHLDRRILNDLEWPVWDSVAKHLQTVLTDEVIDEAVDQLPPEYEARAGATFRQALRTRRDNLHEAAEEFYRHLAGQITIHAGDEDDRVEVIRHDDGTEVRIAQAGDDAPYYQRRFSPGETVEIRIFLHGGADRVEVRGDAPGPKVRLIGGEGPDTLLAPPEETQVRLYDEDEAVVPNGHPVDPKPFVAPSDTNPEIEVEQDWGGLLSLVPRLQHSSHSGLAVGMGVNRTGYGFRRVPYASLQSVSLDYSFARGAPRFRGGSRWRVVNRETYFGFALHASGIEGGRFFGFGDATVAPPDADLTLALRNAYEVSPFLGFGLESHARLWLMLRARHTVTDPNDPTNLASVLRSLQPRGTGDVGQLGPAIRFVYDTRDTRVAATSGVLLEMETDYYPVTWARGEGPFGSIEGRVSTYLSPVLPERLTFALQAGGRQVWGEYPYFEAAYLGGKRSLRGYHSNRFAGDRSVFGNAEVRIKLAESRLVVPIEIGILGLADAGRIWFQDEPASWRSSIGAGAWFSVLKRTQGLSFGLGRGSEGTRFWLVLGTPF